MSRESCKSSVPWTSGRSRLSRRSCSARRKPWGRWQPCWCCEKSGKPAARRTPKADQSRSRRKAIELISEAQTAGAGLLIAWSEIGICLRTLNRWRKAVIADGVGHDRRKGRPRRVLNKLSEEERQSILLTWNKAEYASMPPGQIVPSLADQALYIGSESSIYRVLHAHDQVHRGGRVRPP